MSTTSDKNESTAKWNDTQTARSSTSRSATQGARNLRRLKTQIDLQDLQEHYDIHSELTRATRKRLAMRREIKHDHHRETGPCITLIKPKTTASDTSHTTDIAYHTSTSSSDTIFWRVDVPSAVATESDQTDIELERLPSLPDDLPPSARESQTYYPDGGENDKPNRLRWTTEGMQTLLKHKEWPEDMPGEVGGEATCGWLDEVSQRKLDDILSTRRTDGSSDTLAMVSV